MNGYSRKFIFLPNCTCFPYFRNAMRRRICLFFHRHVVSHWKIDVENRFLQPSLWKEILWTMWITLLISGKNSLLFVDKNVDMKILSQSPG